MDELTAYIMEENGISEKEAEYMLKNPCLGAGIDACEAYKESNGCAGCTDLNGFVMIKTSEESEPKPTKHLLDILKDKKTLVLVKKSDSDKE